MLRPSRTSPVFAFLASSFGHKLGHGQLGAAEAVIVNFRRQIDHLKSQKGYNNSLATARTVFWWGNTRNKCEVLSRQKKRG